MIKKVNFKYLSLLSNHDKLNHNIRVYLLIQSHDEFKQYIDNQCAASIVNYLKLEEDLNDDLEFYDYSNYQDMIPYSLIPDSVHTLVISPSKHSQNSGPRSRFQQSITKLYFYCHIERSEFVEEMLSHLPSKLETLSLQGYHFIGTPLSKRFVLPATLTEFTYQSNWDNLQRFVAPPNKELGATLLLNDDRPIEALEWMKLQTWVSGVDVISNFHCFINDVLPTRLKHLRLPYHIYQLSRDKLPSSLKQLYMVNYNQGLLPHVLPNGLEGLCLWCFNQPLQKDSLPQSLKNLHLSNYRKSFSSVGPLNNLQRLVVKILNKSVSQLIANVKAMTIIFEKIDNDVTFQNTSLRELCLLNNGSTVIQLNSNILPPTLEKLKTAKIDILFPNSDSSEIQETDKLL
ncbi:hypothetical protein CYY_006152 [Polysphondylium violaceum]|uniref:Uncharacterized protein n=1 Tax=Polysphondylium violaceum TaxID=133409 RepID=A0A8J4PR50_9MYCE|nr:hypothetical protein CYY_006152 [Polysphondylium violaceum]